MCKDIMFLRESSPGISLGFTINPLFRHPPPPQGERAYLFQPDLRGLTRDGGTYLREVLI